MLFAYLFISLSGKPDRRPCLIPPSANDHFLSSPNVFWICGSGYLRPTKRFLGSPLFLKPRRQLRFKIFVSEWFLKPRVEHSLSRLQRFFDFFLEKNSFSCILEDPGNLESAWSNSNGTVQQQKPEFGGKLFCFWSNFIMVFRTVRFFSPIWGFGEEHPACPRAHLSWTGAKETYPPKKTKSNLVWCDMAWCY